MPPNILKGYINISLYTPKNNRIMQKSEFPIQDKRISVEEFTTYFPKRYLSSQGMTAKHPGTRYRLSY